MFLKKILLLSIVCNSFIFNVIQSTTFENNKSFVVVIPSYNNKKWYKHNLDSVFMQDYPNYRVIYIDDCSSDGTADLVENYIQEQNKKDKVTLIKNDKRCRALENTYRAVWMCEPHEIVVILDGDDWLYDATVLSFLNEVYQNSTVWLTYGQRTIYKAKLYSNEVINQNSFRESHWNNQHLRTFYAALFHKIKIEDLLYKGDFFSYTADAAYMFPLFEMAGTHIHFISKILYVWNRANPINDDKVSAKMQVDQFKIIKKREKYKPLLSLF